SEPVRMAPHSFCRSLGVSGSDCTEQLSMLANRILEPSHPIEREKPDAQGQDVVLVQGRCQERVVRALVDVAVAAALEVDARPLVRLVAHVVELFQQDCDAATVGVRCPFGSQASGARLQCQSYLRQTCEVANGNA